MARYKERKDAPKSIQEKLKEYPALLQRLLFHRGIKTEKEAQNFLNPDWERDNHDPFLILNMKSAVKRILKAIDKNEKIVIYGDFDCDGIPGSVLLHDFFKKIGYKNFFNYIPHRHDEGYGLHIAAVEQFIKKEAELLITVDVGITDIEAVKVAQGAGIDVIITDHHIPTQEKGKEVLPPAYAIINSKQKDDTYPDDMLCGAGVAFKLVQALLKEGKKNTKGKYYKFFNDISKGWEKWLLDMVGIATLADMVPLQKENRTFASFGLKVLQKTRRKGLCTLLQKIKIEQKNLSEDDITFMIAPRINAASRMDHPVRAFELLATEDVAEAESFADYLEKLNQKRKGHVAAIIKDTKKKIKKRELREVIVVGNPDWSPGILGLVANNLAEEFERPVFVWGYDNEGKIKGSCRGNGISVIDLIRAAPEDTFLQFGGHAGACGFSIKHDNIHNLEKVLEDVYKKMVKKQDENMTWIDHILSLDDVNWKTYQEIEQLAPFGVGNEKPLFLFKEVEIVAVRLFGKEKNHLGLDFKNSAGKKVSAIGFFVDDKSFGDIAIEAGERVHMVATLEKSFFRNFKELRLRIVDIITS